VSLEYYEGAKGGEGGGRKETLEAKR